MELVYNENVVMELSDPPRVSQTELELGNNFEYDFIISEGAYGSYELYGTVRLSFGAL